MREKAVKVWVIPLIASLLFFYVLLFKIPYARGYGWDKEVLHSFLREVWKMPDWAHGQLVPLISLGLVAWRWKEIAKAPIRGNTLWGGALLALGVLIYCLGLKAETEYFGYAALQILLLAVVLWFWGRSVLALILFPWAFLTFAWPMPFLDSMVALPLRMDMSHVSHVLLNVLGTPTVQSGTAILSAPNAAAGLETGAKFQIDIADPCSGMHSLFALMMISALAAYVSLDSLVLRWLLFFCAIPLAIAGNVVRILMLVWGTEAFGTKFAIGTEENPTWYHMGCGYAVYLVALALLFALIQLFSSKWATAQVAKLPAFPGLKPDGAPQRAREVS